MNLWIKLANDEESIKDVFCETSRSNVRIMSFSIRSWVSTPFGLAKLSKLSAKSTPCLRGARLTHSLPPVRRALASMDPPVAHPTESLSARLWRKSRTQAMLALYHPFVVTLAAGTLKIASFRNFIAQDAFFLQAFAKAYGLALENVDDENAKRSISELQHAVIEELKLHSSFAQAWGVDLTKVSQPNTATTTYTEFLLATAAGETAARSETVGSEAFLESRKLAAFTIAAMTPCMRLYAFLGQTIAKSLDSRGHNSPYHEWVDTYSSETFEASTLQIEQLLDSLAGSLREEEIKHLETLYCQASIFEVEFFSAQPYCQSAHVAFFKKQKSSDFCYLFVSDFDSTCSVADSCPALAEVSIKTYVKTEKEDAVGSSNFLRPSSELRRKWDLLEKSYVEEHNNLMTAILPHQAESSYRPYDYDGLRVMLEQLSQFEIQANSKVVEAGVLQGLDIQEVRKAGCQMLLQEGCGDFLERVSVDPNVETYIISVCWSKTFIEGALSKGGIPPIIVHSNELGQNGCLTSGDIVREVETPLDKERVLEDIVKSLEKRQAKQVITVYIGDSVTDLLCLLKADLGIVVGSSLTLRRVADAFGVSLVPLYRGLLEKEKSQQGWTGSAGVLYTVTDWLEIHAFLMGPPV